MNIKNVKNINEYKEILKNVKNVKNIHEYKEILKKH